MLNCFPLLNEKQCNHLQFEVTYSYQEWLRLRETWSTFTNLQKTICSYSKQLEDVIVEENDYRQRENASKIQNLKARVKILERNISITRELICNTRYRLNAIIAENYEYEIKMKNDLDLTLIQAEIMKQREQITEQRIKLKKFQNELKLRRRYMFKNLIDIFFPRAHNINNYTPTVFKKNCLCIKFDCIRGLHLPTVAARLGHNEIELCAASGILIHLLECISAILCYPLKHLITFNGSRSILTTRSKMENFKLFASNSSKNSRDRFDQALYLLCEVVVQLRVHCGIGTRELDRPIQSLRELLLTFTGLYRFSSTELIAKFDKISHLSPSIYILIDKEEEKMKKKNSADFILHNFMPLLKFKFNMNEASISPNLLDEMVDDEGEHDELIEPRFRYKRILCNLITVMENDAASAFCMHEKFLVIGFQSGRIRLFDHMGNENMETSGRLHKCAVSCVSVDGSANYILSCANDFSIIIFGIGCAEYNQKLTTKTSAKLVSIAPDFSRNGSGQRFLACAKDLVLYERGMRAELFAGKRRETTLYRGLEKDGTISCLSWNQSLIAFTNETGTRIFDIKLTKCITLVQPMHKSEHFPTAKFPPKHTWLNSATLAIGWANTICICGIVQNTRRMSTTSELFEMPKRYGQILHKFVLNDFIIAGISLTTHCSYGCEGGIAENINQNPRQSLISSPSSAINLPSLSNISSPNGSTKNLQMLANSPATKENSSSSLIWRELIIFGIKKSIAGTNTRESSLLNVTNASISSNPQNISSNDISLNNNCDESAATIYLAQLLLLKPISLQEYLIEAEDTIEMRNINLKQLHRFTLCSLPLDDIYFIMGPREAIEALPCSIDNRINWLVENGLYEDAFETAIKNVENLRENSVLKVGKRLLNHLIEQKDYATAAVYLPSVCSNLKEEWAYYVNEFENGNQVLKLVPVIPTKDPQLEPENYESILIAALHSRPKLFNAIVNNWDVDIYRGAASIIAKVYEQITTDNANRRRMKTQKDPSIQLLSAEDRIFLLKSLASLHLKTRQYLNAIKTYLLINDPAIFGVIERHKLFKHVKDKIMDLMGINQDLTVRLLLNNEDEITQEEVVNLLGNHPKIQLAYLHNLYSKGNGEKYVDKLIRLYAEYDRPLLLPFLRKNEKYQLDLALDICKRKEYFDEVVFLLDKSGNQLGALDLMVNKLLYIDKAIDFCVEKDDPELWERLIDSAIKRPEHCAILLKRMASIKIDSFDVIEKIPLQMNIPDLRQCLLQVLQEHEQQMDLLRHSKSASQSDALELFKTQLTQLATISNWEEQKDSPQELKCTICNTKLVDSSKSEFHLLANGRMIHDGCRKKITKE